MGGNHAVLELPDIMERNSGYELEPVPWWNKWQNNSRDVIAFLGSRRLVFQRGPNNRDSHLQVRKRNRDVNANEDHMLTDSVVLRKDSQQRIYSEASTLCSAIECANVARRSRRCEEHGAAYLLAITTLVVGLILALALLRSSNAGFLSESGRADVGRAKYTAEAGVDYAAWQVLDQHVDIPYTADVTLTGKSFHVTAADDTARDPDTVLITSVGTASGNSYTSKRVVECAPLPYDYAWCQSTSLSSSQAMVITSAKHGLRVNGNINLSNSGNNITTGALASGTITASGTVTPRYPSGPSLTFPTIDNTYYRSIANVVYNSDHTFNEGQLAFAQPTLIYVSGEATLQCSSYTGMVTIVASGSIRPSVTITASNQNSYLALISATGIDIITKNVDQLQAILYTHNSNKTGNVHWRDDIQFIGAVCTDTTTISGSPLIFGNDPRITHSILTQMHLPGL